MSSHLTPDGSTDAGRDVHLTGVVGMSLRIFRLHARCEIDRRPSSSPPSGLQVRLKADTTDDARAKAVRIQGR